MASITDNNSYLNALANTNQRMPFTKASLTTVAGGYFSLWSAVGQPGAGTVSAGNITTGAICTSATAGAFTYANAGTGNIYLNRATAGSSSVGTLVVYDRLWHGGAYTSVAGVISANTTTAITRSATGDGVELWAEIATVLSATTTITVTYINQAGTTGRTATCTLPSLAIASRMFPFALQAGDTGIRQITNISGSAAPTGTFNLVMLERQTELPMPLVGISCIQDFASTGLPVLEASSCLALMMATNTTTSGTVSGTLSLIG
jgi:hypothetical protein